MTIRRVCIDRAAAQARWAAPGSSQAAAARSTRRGIIDGTMTAPLTNVSDTARWVAGQRDQCAS